MTESGGIIQLTEFEFREDISPDQIIVPVVAAPHEPSFLSLCVQLAQVYEHLEENGWPMQMMVCVGARVVRTTPQMQMGAAWEFDPKWGSWKIRGGDN